MFSFIFDLQLALHYDILTYSVKIQIPPPATGRSLRSVVSMLSVVTSVIPLVLLATCSSKIAKKY